MTCEYPINPNIRSRTHYYSSCQPHIHDNIEMDLKEIVWEDMDWIHLAQNSVQWWVCEHSNEHSCSIKYKELLF
jgi:hypothetical protein